MCLDESSCRYEPLVDLNRNENRLIVHMLIYVQDVLTESLEVLKLFFKKIFGKSICHFFCIMRAGHCPGGQLLEAED